MFDKKTIYKSKQNQPDVDITASLSMTTDLSFILETKKK